VRAHLAIGLALATAACTGRDPGKSDPAPVVAETVTAVLPTAAGRFAPAHVQLATDARIDGEYLADIDACDSCHPDVAAQWRTSAHLFASFNNPVYRVAVQRFRDEVGNEESRFCGGCHDVPLLVDGAMDRDIEPHDARAHSGITCRTCHGISDVERDGNGSFTVRSAAIPLPASNDASSLERHKQVASRSAVGAELCASCHRSFLGTETGLDARLAGMDEVTAWSSSAHSGNGAGRVDDAVERNDCISCHMAPEPAVLGDEAATDGAVSSHRFIGGHTYLAAMRNDPEQLERVQAFLRGIASIDVAAAFPAKADAALPADGAAVEPGERLAFDVVVRNLDVGHRFPGGVLDAQDTWIEVAVTDANGLTLARSGADHAASADDTEAHVLRAIAANSDGTPLYQREVGHFRAVVVNNTIAPRDAIAVRFAFDVPKQLTAAQLPLRVEATLRHRTRNLMLQAEACADARGERGRAFAAGTAATREIALDPCVDQPITDISSSTVWIGDGWRAHAAADARPTWRRLYEHGLALLHAVQERVGEARPSLEAALAAIYADPEAPVTARAMIYAALGKLTGRQGRTDEALEWLDKADAIVPGHAAVAAFRGEALTRVWRWQEAIAPLTIVTEKAPDNVGAWASLAIALGSAGRDTEALRAAQAGLALQPRHPDLLRVQAVSLAALDADRTMSGAALDAYDDNRTPDRATDIRIACTARYPDCAREREPVHVHVMTSE
jgi:tetratricopeptide (TPR) repeat protein